MDPPPPPHTQTKELPTSWRGAKFIWRAVLIFNLGLGAYLFTRPAKKERKANIAPPVIPAETSTPTPPAPQNFEPIFTPIPEPVKVPEPLSVDQQRSVFEWMLEEKRKVKPQNREEKKRINEEKALLKQFIRADSIPKI
uniref:WAS/WASL-interacting protein family member 3-like n=1 Tax=Nicotiana tabacum TaxID=4097 RepID=A0A1S4ASD6_TOBAC|nr:PREDICTED: uncharacterized protein LOC107800713 [Nicotiana tabacum]